MKHTKKIIFIVPNYSSRSIRKWGIKKTAGKKKDFECYPPLGLLYLAGSIKKNTNFEICILDAKANQWSLEELEVAIINESPDIVGITVTSFTLYQTFNIIKNILNNLTNKPLIILGGPHISKRPEDIEIFGADYGFIGDSEISILQFLDYYFGSGNIDNVNGLVYRKEGKIIVNPIYLSEDINKFALPDRTLVNSELYYFSITPGKLTSMLTSRGCPFNCIYCSVPHKREYHFRKIDDVLNEIKQIKNQGYEYINFSDDVFTIKKERIIELCSRLIEEKIEINWGCATRADLVDLELLKLMKKAGCIDIRIGIETGSEKIRNEVMGKKISDGAIRDAIMNIKKAKLLAVGFFLIGIPGETKKDIESTIKFACSLPLDFASFNLVTPLPGSRLYEIALKENKIENNIWKKIIEGDRTPPVYIPDGLDMTYLEQMIKTAFRKFYIRPTYLFSQLVQIRSWNDLLHKIKIAKRLLF